jgi:hypothetical protein
MISETVVKQQLEVFRDLKDGRITQEEAGHRLLQIDPNHGPALLFVAGAREQTGDFDEAESLMWKALERMPCRHLAYFALNHFLGSRDIKDPRLDPLLVLALWKLSNLNEIPEGEVEFFKKLDVQGGDFTRPETFAELALAMEERGDENANPEPAEITALFLPYRLLNDLQLEAEDGLPRELLQRIQDNGARCAPLFRGALHDWSERPEFVSHDSICLIAALCGETAGPEVLDDLINYMDHGDADMFAHSHWAAWRLGRRFPAEALAFYRSLIPQARLVQLCAIAEQMGLLPDTPGLADALLATLDRLPAFADEEDAPYLLAIVSYALADLGLDEEAAEAMRVRQHQLSGRVRKDFKRLIKDRDGFAPRLMSLGIDELDLEQVCCERGLMEDLAVEDGDEEDADEEPAPEKARAADQDFSELIRALMDASHEWRSADELSEAFHLFFGPQAGNKEGQVNMEGFAEWYIYDYRPQGKRTIAEEYLKRRGGSLSPSRRALLEALCASKFGLREAVRIEEGVGVELRDVFTGDQMFVRDVSSSKSLVRWDCVLNRVFHFEGRSEFSGNGFLVPRNLLQPLMDRVREGAQAARRDPAEHLRMMSHEWGRAVEEIRRHQMRDLRVVNAEGDEIEFSSSTYQLIDEKAAAVALAAAKVFEETTSEKDSRGERHFGWMEADLGGPRRSYGHIEMHHGLLKLECNSRKRLSIGRQLIEKHAGEFLRHLTDTFKSVDEIKESALAGGGRTQAAPAAPKDIPPEVEHEILLQYKTQHYSTWADIPLPALEGRTPREAVRSEVGRRAVDDLLRDMENSEERGRKRGDPAFDFSPIRKELGL